MTRITSLEVENMYRIKAVTLQFSKENGVFILGGRNEQGKSSTIDALWSAIRGKATLGKEPVRKGAKEGRATVRLDNSLSVTRRVRPGGWTDLVVESTDGATFKSPQTLLGKLFGEYLDPVELSRMNDKELQAMLEHLAGVDYTELDQEREDCYSKRTLVNRDLKQLQARIDKAPHYEDAPTERVFVSQLAAELERAQKHNGELEAAQVKIDDAADEVADIEGEIAALKKRLKRAVDDLAVLKIAHSKMGEHIDTSPIKARLNDADNQNRKYDANYARATMEIDLKEIIQEADALTDRIREIDKAKTQMLIDAKLPVSGLSFSDAGVFYNGLPIEQESSSSRLKIFTPMLIAMLPPAGEGVRLLFIREGSHLDDDNLKLISDLAEAENVQVIMERVTTDPARCSVIIEDGMVAGGEDQSDKQ